MINNIGLVESKVTPLGKITLEEFISLPYIDESPAWEYINGAAIQKFMGGGKHSLLQKRLVAFIDGLGSEFEAFPELRCSFGDRSVVPDVVVIGNHQIPLDENGDIISSGIDFAPPWIIEILSPAQSQTKVTGNILHCLRNGSLLGWLIDPSERSILVFQPHSLPLLLLGNDVLPVLDGLGVNVTVEDVFSWVKRKG
ncbi:MAG: Uma2 family endonuclease [Sphaerospermopsis sp.]|nr:Uma2 family endonuclease [Sphaerospermopsis sp.]